MTNQVKPKFSKGDRKTHYITINGEMLHIQFGCSIAKLKTTRDKSEVDCTQCLNVLFGYRNKLPPRSKGVSYHSTINSINLLSSFCQIRFWYNKNKWIIFNKELSECVLNRLSVLIKDEINKFVKDATIKLKEDIEDDISQS